MDVTAKHLHDENAAREYIEKLRWPDGPVCPHCGVIGTVYRLPIRQGKKGPKRQVLKCGSCRQQFSLLIGTIFEDSHIPLHKWLAAFDLYASSKKGFSAHQLHRTLKLTYKSAWFLAHRVRYCMERSPLKEKLAGIVEADETYIGGKPRRRQPNKGPAKGWLDRKTPVVTLVERGGKARSFVTERVTAASLGRVLAENVLSNTRLMTDSHPSYRTPGKQFASHETVDHLKDEYARGGVTTNTVEGYFSILKRGINGVYHHVGRQHLHRYLSEFDFRYNNRVRLGVDDDQRARLAVKQIEGRRLMYRRPRGGSPDGLEHLG
jgi:transposase-like protein